MRLCDASVSYPLVVTPIHNGTTYVNMVNVLQNGYRCVLKDIVDVKQFWKKLNKFYYLRHTSIILYQLCQILLKTLFRTDVRKYAIFKPL